MIAWAKKHWALAILIGIGAFFVFGNVYYNTFGANGAFRQ